MKISRIAIFFINLSAILGGIILILVSASLIQEIWKTLFDSIGISLIATGGVNMLAQFFIERPQVAGARMISPTRNTLDRAIHERKYRADKIEAVGVSLSGFLHELSNNAKMAERVLFSNTRLRLIFVNPLSPYLAQRAIEDNMGHGAEALLRRKQLQSVECCIQFYKCLQGHYQSALRENPHIRPLGVVQVKMTDFCPYLTIERYDNDIYWGLYTTDTAGEFAPMFLTNRDENYLLYDKLKNHFVALLNKDPMNDTSPKDNFLIKMESGEPWLNRDLAEKLLGNDIVTNLLGEAQ